MTKNDVTIPTAESAVILTDKEFMQDGLENLIASLGTANDKRRAGRFVNNKRLSHQGNEAELTDMYRTEWLAGKVVDIIPDDMTREWRSFTGEDITPEQLETLIDEEDRLDLRGTFNQAHKWSRLYGTSFIVMSIDDGQPPWMPLDVRRLREKSLRHIKAIDRTMINTATQIPIVDPLSPNYGFPEFYRFNETSVVIHHSRVIRFDAVMVPFKQFRENNYFSDSVLDRLYESILNFNTVADGSASMVYETNVDVLQFKGLMQHLQSAEGETLVRKRLALAGLFKSFNNMMLMDEGETLTSKQNTFSGLPDLLDRFGQILASASDIPATRLLGSSASGMNATGEGDLKNYYDKISAHQTKDYKPKLDMFDKIMALSLGFGDSVDLSYEFNSLFQMSDKELAETQLARAQRDNLYYDMDVINASTIAKDLQQDGTYQNISDEDIKELEGFENGDDPESTIDPDSDDIDPEKEEKTEEGAGDKNSKET